MLDTTILVALTVGLVEVVKGLGIAKKYIPLVAIVIGVTFAIVGNISGELIVNITTGLGIGLASCGLFDFTKKTVLGK